MLKRGMAATIEELLLAAEYVLSEGNERSSLRARHPHVRATAPATRSTSARSPVLKKETHLPVIVDPSHARGHRDLTSRRSALAAVAAGADGLIVEVHPHPEHALSDGPQQIPSAQFASFVDEVESYLVVAGKTLSR